jgi:hypothetical protein
MECGFGRWRADYPIWLRLHLCLALMGGMTMELQSGSVVTTIDTLGKTLGSGEPQDVSLSPNSAPRLTPTTPGETRAEFIALLGSAELFLA